MKTIIVYVEGRSDVRAMEALLAPLIDQLLKAGTRVEFVEAPAGDRKLALLERVPVKAVNTLVNDTSIEIVVVPDLYPSDKSFSHRTLAELQDGILARFHRALVQRGLGDDDRLRTRFHVFCFKHDLEALLLAVPEILALRLNVEAIPITWRIPVEEQNHHQPPKFIVEALFRQYATHYTETKDAPLILGLADYRALAEACPVGFGALVAYLIAQM